jgi:casein kinase II subunit alpha
MGLHVNYEPVQIVWRYDFCACVFASPSGLNILSFYAVLFSDAADFQLDYDLGGGAYAQTFLAHNITSGEQYAIKTFLLGHEEKASMLREIYVVQSLCGHRNIIKLPFVVQQSLTRYPALVFEFIKNTNFYKLLASITSEEAQFYIHEMISGVAHAHSKGIVHRDIKPANIMIHNATRTLKIIDWGLSRHHAPG